MSDKPLNVLCVVGSLNETSITRVVIANIADQLRVAGCAVDVLDLDQEPLALYDPDTAEDQPHFAPLQTRVARADVFVLGTPDYHGCISSAMKNFLDHFWHEFTGKLFCPVVASMTSSTSWGAPETSRRAIRVIFSSSVIRLCFV